MEDLSERELEHLYARYQQLAAMSTKLAAGAKNDGRERPGGSSPAPSN